MLVSKGESITVEAKRSRYTMESEWYLRGGGFYTARFAVRGSGFFAAADRSVEGLSFKEVVANAIELEKKLNDEGTYKFDSGHATTATYEPVSLTKQGE